MIKLCVNIDHIATIREARKTIEPDPTEAAKEACLGGADGITLHIREDRRHMQNDDLYRLREVVTVPLNLEMAATSEMINLALHSKPDMAMLVPEGREEITTEGGLQIVENQALFQDAVSQLRDADILVSAFVGPDQQQVDAVRTCGFEVCEIHTGAFAEAFILHDFSLSHPAVQQEQEKVSIAVQHAINIGLQCNAGHGLTRLNVGGIASIPHLTELHIGHSIVSRSVFIGMQASVREMTLLIKDSQND